MTAVCDKRSQPLRRPKVFVSIGRGSLSTIGAHMNLNEYPSAAQLK